MYGASETEVAVDEEAPLKPLTAYAESKVRSEEGLVELAGPDFAPVSMRNATVFGVSPRLRLDIVLNNLAAWSHTTGRIRLLSDGSAWRPLVHVRDVAKATLALLDAPEEQIRGEAFNVGSDDQNYLVRDLAEQLSEITGCIVEVAEGSSADQRSYRVDFSKLGRLLPGLTLDWNAERGGRELVDAYRRVGLTKDDSTVIASYASADCAACSTKAPRRRPPLAVAAASLIHPSAGLVRVGRPSVDYDAPRNATSCITQVPEGWVAVAL